MAEEETVAETSGATDVEAEVVSEGGHAPLLPDGWSPPDRGTPKPRKLKSKRPGRPPIPEGEVDPVLVEAAEAERERLAAQEEAVEERPRVPTDLPFELAEQRDRMIEANSRERSVRESPSG